MNWFIQLLLEESIPQTVIIFGVVIAIGTWLGRVKIFGISLGVTWILFMGLAVSYATVDPLTMILRLIAAQLLILFLS